MPNADFAEKKMNHPSKLLCTVQLKVLHLDAHEIQEGELPNLGPSDILHLLKGIVPIGEL